MGKQHSIKNERKPAAAGEDTSLVMTDAMPKMALAEVDAVRVESLIQELKAESVPVPEAQQCEGADSATAPLEIASVEAPHITPEAAWASPAEEEAALAQEPPAGQDPDHTPRAGVSRFTLLAACLALAAAFGGMMGALAAYSFTRPQPAAEVTIGGLEDIQALKESLIQARVDLTALKTAIDAGTRTASTQFTKITERIERIERNAAEPAARLTKAAESLERISRAEVTGGIAPAQAAPPAAKLEGWTLRDVHHGTALIEGRSGLIEVEQGDLIPGLGRIDAIRKQQDGRWVVVTSKGSIVAPK